VLQRLLPRSKEVGSALLEALRRLGTEVGRITTRLTSRLRLAETGSAYTLRADVPGFAREDLQVFVQGNLLVIEGERGATHHHWDLGRQFAVRYRGRLYRAALLPPDADAEGIRTVLRGGVLEITIPRTSRRRNEVEETGD